MRSIDKFTPAINKMVNKLQNQADVNNEGSFFLYREWRTICPISVFKRQGKAVMFYEGLTMNQLKMIYGENW